MSDDHKMSRQVHEWLYERLIPGGMRPSAFHEIGLNMALLGDTFECAKATAWASPTMRKLWSEIQSYLKALEEGYAKGAEQLAREKAQQKRIEQKRELEPTVLQFKRPEEQP